MPNPIKESGNIFLQTVSKIVDKGKKTQYEEEMEMKKSEKRKSVGNSKDQASCEEPQSYSLHTSQAPKAAKPKKKENKRDG